VKVTKRDRADMTGIGTKTDQWDYLSKFDDMFSKAAQNISKKKNKKKKKKKKADEKEEKEACDPYSGLFQAPVMMNNSGKKRKSAASKTSKPIHDLRNGQGLYASRSQAKLLRLQRQEAALTSSSDTQSTYKRSAIRQNIEAKINKSAKKTRFNAAGGNGFTMGFQADYYEKMMTGATKKKKGLGFAASNGPSDTNNGSGLSMFVSAGELGGSQDEEKNEDESMKIVKQKIKKPKKRKNGSISENSKPSKKKKLFSLSISSLKSKDRSEAETKAQKFLGSAKKAVNDGDFEKAVKKAKRFLAALLPYVNTEA